MAHEMLRARLKLSDSLAGGPYRNEASLALEALVRLPASQIEDMFSPYERECLPQWAQDGIAFALRQPRPPLLLKPADAVFGQRVVEAESCRIARSRSMKLPPDLRAPT